MAKKKTAKKITDVPSRNGTGLLCDLKEVYQFMQDNSLHSVELDRKDFHIRLVRRSAAAVPVAVPVPMAGTPIPAGHMAPVATGVPAPPEGIPAGCRALKAPMMGIFYRAASPSSPPFFKEGDSIKKGDVVCLIEAMKVFNDVKTDFGGIIRSIPVDDGKSVKIGQDLFIIEPQ